MALSRAQYCNQILCGDAYQALRQLPDARIDCVVTSPPYWRLRDYGMAQQLGLEPSVSAYLRHLDRVFTEIRRVLTPTGTCWVNLGDTYGGKSLGRTPPNDRSGRHISSCSRIPKKSLAQIPARFALQMAQRGWLLRNEIIWWKPNCLPSSATDRFTVDYEKMFFFVKEPQYHFTQQFEPALNPGRLQRRAYHPANAHKRSYGDSYIAAINPRTAAASQLKTLARGRNVRCVWRIAPKGLPGAHFAVYPTKLIETPIKAGCPLGGIVLDPFLGSGTTALVARQLGRNFVGIELNPAYVKLARERLAQEGQ